jgi:hypothetical protein
MGQEESVKALAEGCGLQVLGMRQDLGGIVRAVIMNVKKDRTT